MKRKKLNVFSLSFLDIITCGLGAIILLFVLINAKSAAQRETVTSELRGEVDWILVDSPAGIERGFRNAIAPADIVIVVTNPEVSSVRDADRIIGLIEAEEKGPARLIINRLKPSMVKRGEMLSTEDVVELLAIELIGIIPEDEEVVISTNRGTPVAMDGKNRAGTAFRNIAQRMQGQVVPFIDLEEQNGLFGRISRLFRPGGA